MSSAVLDERGRDILKRLIQIHVATGEPVGSESLAKSLERTLSPATLRNVMADLERLGYLDHPHTSAGRVPTDDGYRLYVDALMSNRPLPAHDAAAIDAALQPREGSSAQVLQNASQLLSRLSHHVGFVLAPDLAQTAFLHVDLVRLPPPRVLAVLLSSGGIVTQKLLSIDEDLTQEQLQTCANYLNTNYTGQPLNLVRARLIELMREEQALYDSLLQRVVAVGERVLRPDDSANQVYLDGASNMLGQPEFDDLDRMRSLFKTFEEKGRLVRILNACIAGRGLRVTIGHENPEPEWRDVALVTSSVDGEPGLGIGVLGSTRMEYDRMTTLVAHVARAVQTALLELRL